LVRKREGKRPLVDLDVDGRIILKWILGNRMEGCGLDSSGSEYGPVAGSCKHGDEPSGSIKGGEFFSSCAYYWLLKKDSGTWGG
jgi:hypothetical protein